MSKGKTQGSKKKAEKGLEGQSKPLGEPDWSKVSAQTKNALGWQCQHFTQALYAVGIKPWVDDDAESRPDDCPCCGHELIAAGFLPDDDLTIYKCMWCNFTFWHEASHKTKAPEPVWRDFLRMLKNAVGMTRANEAPDQKALLQSELTQLNEASGVLTPAGIAAVVAAVFPD